MKKALLFLSILFFINSGVARDINSLLDELAQKDDLSMQTRKETAGLVTVFTRKDLDRMKIRSLDEIIEELAFVNNKLDNKGFTNPFYKPYQHVNSARIRLFINDREIITPIYGSGLKVFGQMDMSYIDHIQVYYALPSYEISFQPSVIVIKAYTKVGKRENLKTIGSSIGTYGTTDTYAYSSENLEDFSYIAYINHRNLNRKKVHNLGSELSRDKKTTNMFTQISNDTSSFELQVADGEFDQFAGSSWDMTPITAKGDYTYLSTSLSRMFQDESLKLSLHYAYIDTNNKETATSPIGIVPPITPYYASEVETKEHFVDFKVTKNYYIDDASILIGANNRLATFTLNEYYSTKIKLPRDSSFDRENIISVFAQIEHDLSNKHKVIASSNLQRHFYNGGIDDENTIGARLGHIYNGNSIMQKTFLMYGKFTPSTQVRLYYDMGLLGSDELKKENAYSLATESIWAYSNVDLSLMMASTIYNNALYIDTSGIHNAKERQKVDNIYLSGTYNLGGIDKIDFSFWATLYDFGKSALDRYREEFGSTFSLYKKFLFLDSYNSLTYVNEGSGGNDGWNYSATLSYRYSKDLEFFVKARNIFDTALKSDFMSINPITNQITRLEDISNVDRSIWLGLEYQF